MLELMETLADLDGLRRAALELECDARMMDLETLKPEGVVAERKRVEKELRRIEIEQAVEIAKSGLKVRPQLLHMMVCRAYARRLEIEAMQCIKKHWPNNVQPEGAACPKDYGQVLVETSDDEVRMTFGEHVVTATTYAGAFRELANKFEATPDPADLFCCAQDSCDKIVVRQYVMTAVARGVEYTLTFVGPHETHTEIWFTGHKKVAESWTAVTEQVS